MPFEALAKKGCCFILVTIHYVYLLCSLNHPSKTYIGLTDNLKARLKNHNEGGTANTSKHRP
jgi:predicted GIY-YIG superfamily endonuclease